MEIFVRAAQSLRVRPFIILSFTAVMVLSLVYSASFQYGHADVPVAATAQEINPLVAGDQAPRFTVISTDGENFEFDPRSLHRPVMLISFRGGWCPYCNMHLAELRHVLPEIADMGVDVLFLSGDRSELLVKSLSREARAIVDELDYTLLSDANAQAAIALGIAFKASDRLIARRHEKGNDIESSSMAKHGVLPVPAVFAIDRSGTIRFAHADPDYRVRLSGDKLLAVARDLVQNDAG